MPFWDAAVLFVHFALLAVLCLFGLHRLSMVFRWFLHKNKPVKPATKFEQLPTVTVQIPLYNERFVAERIVDCIAAIDYPREKLQLQIVDDSTDATTDILAERIAHYRQQGVVIEHVRRVHRQGYKAGALKDAMSTVSGEFIAIFDADFLPQPSIIKDCIHYFTDARVGMVQCRWEHLNRNSSYLTELQSVMLDAHFGLEQTVRSASDLFLNFNGTAGLWRASTIIDAGHWSADTLTEDLDLSYRAQLKGWKMRYLNHISCPAEVPSDMNAFKSQQHRWAKGGTEVMLKILGRVWRSTTSLKRKVESTFHLSNNLAYLVFLLDTLIFLIPSVLLREKYQIEYIWWIDLPLLIGSATGHVIYLVFGQFALARKKPRAILNIPGLLLLGIKISFNNACAGFEALFGKKSGFVRTPKNGELSKPEPQFKKTGFVNYLKNRRKKSESYPAVAPRGAIFEFSLAGVFVGLFIWCFQSQLWFMLPFMLFLIAGYLSTSIDSFLSYHRLKINE